MTSVLRWITPWVMQYRRAKENRVHQIDPDEDGCWRSGLKPVFRSRAVGVRPGLELLSTASLLLPLHAQAT